MCLGLNFIDLYALESWAPLPPIGEFEGTKVDPTNETNLYLAHGR